VKRRELLFLLGSAVVTPRALRAQQKTMPVIGFLGVTSPNASALNLATFHQGLSEAGFVEGQKVATEYRWAEGYYDRLLAMVADLVGHKVDVLATSGGVAAALAAKSATSTIPIVFVVGVEDPASSLASPRRALT
jgi:putative ABC transport system substrate-binding protein